MWCGNDNLAPEVKDHTLEIEFTVTVTITPVIKTDLTSDILPSLAVAHYRTNVQCTRRFVLCFFAIWTPTHFSGPDLFTSAEIGCTSPPCTSTAFGWGISPRSSCCCRSLRRSSCAWRPCSSSALVRAVLCSEHGNKVRGLWNVKPKLFLLLTSSSRGSEESEVLWRAASHLHQRTRSAHQLSNGDQLFSEVLPAHPTAGLAPDGETTLLPIISG